MRIYGLASIAGGVLLGLLAMVMGLLRTGGNGSYRGLAICMALSSVGLFIGGTIFYVASCCHAQAPEAENTEAENTEAENPEAENPKAKKPRAKKRK